MAEEREICRPCQDAIELDQVALVEIDLGKHYTEHQSGDVAEIAVIACDAHLRRLALALEVLDAVEQIEQFHIPRLANAVFASRVKVNPGRPS